jgi:hypothetical protein
VPNIVAWRFDDDRHVGRGHAARQSDDIVRRGDVGLVGRLSSCDARRRQGACQQTEFHFRIHHVSFLSAAFRSIHGRPHFNSAPPEYRKTMAP